jgi:hypothetical protein
MNPVSRLTTIDWPNVISVHSEEEVLPSSRKTERKSLFSYFQLWLAERKLPLMGKNYHAMYWYAVHLEMLKELGANFQ